MLAALRDHGQTCTRMGAYKPRTNPYSFQGYGKDCLPYVFDLAGKYGIKVIAMEITTRIIWRKSMKAWSRPDNPPESWCKSARATRRISSC